MKTTITLVAFTLLIPVAASAQDGRLQLDILDKLAARASEKQEVTLDSSMLTTTGPFLPQGPRGDAAKQVLSQLKGIYVRNYEFDDEKAFSMDDINTLRRQLTTPGWMKIVSNEEKGKGANDWELQEVYVFQPGGKLGGIAIISAEPGELSVVNIVGPIDLQALGALGGVLGIPGLPGLGLAPPPPPPPPAPPRK